MTYKYRHQETYNGVQIDCRAHTMAELIEKVNKRRNQIDRQTIGGNMLLADFCKMYLETYKTHISDSWYYDLTMYSRRIVCHIGNRPIKDIKPMEVQRFLNSLSYLSESAIKKIYDLTVQIFASIAAHGATSYTFDLIRPRGRPPTAGRSLTDAEQRALLKVLDGHRGELFIKIMYYCGLRPSEVSALLWADIDFDREIIKVTKALKKDGVIGATKSPSGVREVPIPTILSSLMKRHRKSPFSLVCEQSNGYHTKSSLRKMWASVKKEMEKELGVSIEPCRMYDIRHTYCTNLERAGVPISIASRLMGHSDISITSKVYTHASDESLEYARNCINRQNLRQQAK